MADTCSANIRIAGVVKSSADLAGLAVAACDDAITSWMGNSLSQPKIMDMIALAAERGDVLEFYNEFSRGSFSKLEAYCRAIGLSYVRSNGPGDGIPAMTASWKPGMEAAAEEETTEAGEVVVSVDVLCKLLDLPDTEIMEALRKVIAPKLAASGRGVDKSLQLADGVNIPQAA